MSTERIILIVIGVISIMLLLVLRRKKYQEAAFWKMVLLELLLIVSGVIGTKLMYFIENGRFGGSSLFGAVLFIPVFILPALFMKLSYKDVLNLCAPAVGAMMAIMKFECCFNGCCFGKYLPSLRFQFPSQIVETIFALLVMVIVLIIERRKKDAHLFAWYLVLYGSTRFSLNGFRYGLKPFIWNLSSGHFWALVSVFIGIIWLIIAKVLAVNRNKTTE